MADKGKLVVGFETNCVPDLNALLDDGEQNANYTVSPRLPHVMYGCSRTGSSSCTSTTRITTPLKFALQSLSYSSHRSIDFDDMVTFSGLTLLSTPITIIHSMLCCSFASHVLCRNQSIGHPYSAQGPVRLRRRTSGKKYQVRSHQDIDSRVIVAMMEPASSSAHRFDSSVT